MGTLLQIVSLYQNYTIIGAASQVKKDFVKQKAEMTGCFFFFDSTIHKEIGRVFGKTPKIKLLLYI